MPIKNEVNSGGLHKKVGVGIFMSPDVDSLYLLEWLRKINGESNWQLAL